MLPVVRVTVYLIDGMKLYCQIDSSHVTPAKLTSSKAVPQSSVNDAPFADEGGPASLCVSVPHGRVVVHISPSHVPEHL